MAKDTAGCRVLDRKYIAGGRIVSAETVILSMLNHMQDEIGVNDIKHVLSLCRLTDITDELQGKSPMQRAKRLSNRIRNAFFRKTIIALNERCFQQFLVIKGVFYAEDLYPSPEWRDSGDIDIFIRQESLESIFNALNDLGFTAQFPLSVCLERIRLEHIIFSRTENGFPLEVEVHASALNPAYYYSEYIEKLFDRAMVYQDTNVLIPCTCDRIIHSLLHFCVHLRDYLLESYIARETMIFNARDLLDIALTDEKYSNELSLALLKDYIIEIGAEIDASLSLSIYKLLFPQSRLINVADNITDYEGTHVFKNAKYLVDKIFSAQSISEFFGASLKSFIDIDIPSTFNNTGVLDGHCFESPALKVSLCAKEGYLCFQSMICTNPEEVQGTRVKLYYLSSNDFPTIRMVTFRMVENNLVVTHNGSDLLITDIEYTVIDARHWRLKAHLPINDFKIYNSCIYINPIMEYGIVSQICLFGERWTDIGLWKPMQISNHEIKTGYNIDAKFDS